MKKNFLLGSAILLVFIYLLLSLPSLASIPGDFNYDGKVDFEDLMLFALAYGSTPADANWNEYCDLDPDGKIDFEDLMLFAMNYGETLPVNNLTQDTYHETIQEAINESNPGDTIVVCPGTYYENLVFADKDITVRSVDPSDPDIVAATIIDGDETDSVVIFTGGDTSTLSGFTIQGGESSPGGGIYVGAMDSTNPTITGNTITANTGDGINIYIAHATITGNTITANTGDGINIHDTSASGTITGNTITSNVCGVYLYNASYTIDNNFISDNTNSGISLGASSATITGNSITGNQAENGGGIHMSNQSSPTITGNYIFGNTATNLAGGIFVEYSFNVTITDNSIYDNTSNDGGGIALNYYSSATIAENEIYGNTAYGEGGGIYTEDSTPTIKDNEITGNPATDGGGIFVIGSVGKPTITGNNITDNEVTDEGGGIYMGSGSSPIIDDNNITGNHAADGGGILMYNSSPEITNNEIANNEASDEGGGIYVWAGSTPTIGGTGNFNTICGNSPDQIDPADTYTDNHICNTCPCP